MEAVKHSDTKESLIRATARLIEIKGYFGTGINEILKEVGVPKGSLYHHFPEGKDALVIAALEYSGKKQSEVYAAALKGKPSVEEAIDALILVMVERIETSGYHRSCPLSAVALETSNLNGEIQETCSRIFKNWEKGLASFFNYKGYSKSEELAKIYMNLIEGAFLLSKAHKDVEYLKVINEKAKLLLPLFK